MLQRHLAWYLELRRRGWQIESDALGPVRELLRETDPDMMGSCNKFLKAIEPFAGGG